MMMLNGLSERLRLPDRRVVYTGAEELAGIAPEHILPLAEFRLEAGLPVWRYELSGFVLEKRLLMPYRQNTVHVTYQLLAGNGTLRLGLRPAIHFRPHDAPVSSVDIHKYVLTARDDQFEISAGAELPPLRLRSPGRLRRSHSTAGKPAPFRTRPREAAATNGRALCGARATSARTWRRANRPH